MSAEGNRPEAQELALWDRIGTTEGAERAEVLNELSHFAFKKNNYAECLQLIETSIEIYFNLNSGFHTKQLIHLYEGKALCHENLEQYLEAAEAFEMLAGYCCIDEDRDGFLKAKRAAGRAWFEAKEYEKSLEDHTLAAEELDINATDFSIGIDHLSIGIALNKLERYPEAVDHFLKGRILFKKAKNPEHVNWCDRNLAEAYTALKNGAESLFHAKHYFNFSKVAENLDMESYARYRLGQAFWILKDYESAESEFTRALELMTLDGERDWEAIIKANNELAAVLFALGRDEEAKERLDRIATIEETMCDI